VVVIPFGGLRSAVKSLEWLLDHPKDIVLKWEKVKSLVFETQGFEKSSAIKIGYLTNEKINKIYSRRHI
jgi:hypothetical protein